MNAKQIYDKINESVPDIREYQTPFGKIVDSKKYNAFTERISLEEQIWNRCKPNKELADEVYELFQNQMVK